MAARFDLERLELAGEPTPLVAGVSMESLFGQGHVAISDTGLLAYVPGTDRAVGRLAWVERQGGTEFLDVPARVYGVFDLSPGDRRLAVHVADVTDYIWIYDLQRREGRKLRAAENAGWPVWSADGLRLAFVSGWSYRREAPWKILISPAEGAGEAQLVAPVKGPVNVTSWSPDGLALAINSWGEQTRVGTMSIGKEVDWKGSGFMPHFSPDGRWLSYSQEGEIWVSSYPDAKLRRQISTDGGIEPFWCPSGELFYRNGNQWMSVQISTKPQLVWAPPRLAFDTDFIDTPGRSFAVSADGQRLLVLKRAEPEIRTKLHLIWNWYALLESAQEAK